MSGVGEIIDRRARALGLFLLVDMQGKVRYFPSDRMPDWFLRLLNRHYLRVKYWLITDAITVE